MTQALLRSIASPSPGQVYNVVDDDSSPRSVVLSHAAHLLGMAEGLPSAAVTPAQDPGGGKRVSNAKLKRELGVNLLYPTFREGLAAVYQEEASSADQ